MEFFRTDTHYSFLKQGKAFFAVSIVLVFVSLGLFLTKGLNLGIDFMGGTVIQVKYDQAAPIDKIREAISGHEMFKNAVVTSFGTDEEVLIKTQTSAKALGQDIGDVTAELLKPTGDHEIRRVDMVGPKIGEELKEKGIMAVLLASLAIMIYVSIRYEWRFAVASIVALFHDILITVGAMIIYGVDVNLEVIAALLTILGYSINDTIIVFDRIRETLRENKINDLKEIINESMSRTLSRTTLTSLTVFFVVLTLFLFGGEIIVGFSFPLIIGVIVGTYSSIFIASQVVLWMGFSVKEFRRKEAESLKRQKEKQKLREMYEKGVV